MSQPAKASLNIEMPGVDFAGMAREAIAGKLTEALVGSDTAIQSIVAAAIATKVNDRGQVGQYSSDNKTPFVEWLAQDLIRKATHDVLQQKVERLRPALEKQVEAQLTKNVKSIAASLTEAFIKQASAGYGVVINMTAEMRVRD
ncbi:hypothetical protein [Bradyrhizobium cenepequi]